jgi:hypothetical protein
MSEPVPQRGDLGRGLAQGLDLLRALAARERLGEDGALMNDDGAELYAVVAAGMLAGRHRLAIARRSSVHGQRHRLARKLGDLHVDADRLQIEDAGPRYDQAEVGCARRGERGCLDRGCGIDEGNVSAALPRALERRRKASHGAGDHCRLWRLAVVRPLRGACLRVSVDEGCRAALGGLDREMQRQRRFSGAALSGK